MPSYQPYPVQAAAHRAILVDGYRRAVLYWSRRVGKTQWAIQQLMLSCMMNQGQHHMVFKEYLQAETVAWNQYLHTIPKGLIHHLDKSTLTIYFNYFNGTVKLADPIGEIQLKANLDWPDLLKEGGKAAWGKIVALGGILLVGAGVTIKFLLGKSR